MYGEIRRRPISVRVRDTSVACRPDSPRPKDCPGLGDPNTLKLIKTAKQERQNGETERQNGKTETDKTAKWPVKIKRLNAKQ